MFTTNKNSIRAAITVAATAGLVLTIAPAASASPEPKPAIPAGSFTWHADFKVLLKSRVWAQNAGGTKITSYADCTTDPGLTTYAIEMWKDEFFPKSYGNVTYQCNATQEYTWNNLPSGSYYFMISKRDGNSIHANGTTAYP